jgi:hypothetical protein
VVLGGNNDYGLAKLKTDVDSLLKTPLPNTTTDVPGALKTIVEGVNSKLKTAQAADSALSTAVGKHSDTLKKLLLCNGNGDGKTDQCVPAGSAAQPQSKN